MENPFKYGNLAQGEGFCNRVNEVKRIQNAFRDGQNIIVISPRRWGKSSLVDEAIRRDKSKVIIAKIDCFRVRSEDELYLALLKNILKASGSKIQDIVKTAQDFLGDLVSSISFTTEMTGEIKIGVNLPANKRDPAYILDLAQKIAERKKQRVVICFDEFQKIAEWKDGRDILEKLRSHWMNHDKVCYCLYGSKRHLMENIFSNKSQPFYRFGEMLFLQKIEEEEWAKYIVKRFKKTSKKINKDQALALVKLANSHSYHVLYLSRICWNNTQLEITQNIIDRSFEEFINDHDDLFIRLTDRLTKFQINYLKAFCLGEKQFSSQRVLREYDIGTAGNIKRIEKVMKDLEIIDYYQNPHEFSDPYFQPLFKSRFL